MLQPAMLQQDALRKDARCYTGWHNKWSHATRINECTYACVKLPTHASQEYEVDRRQRTGNADPSRVKFRKLANV
jgi:hypothetical protein